MVVISSCSGPADVAMIPVFFPGINVASSHSLRLMIMWSCGICYLL